MLVDGAGCPKCSLVALRYDVVRVGGDIPYTALVQVISQPWCDNRRNFHHYGVLSMHDRDMQRHVDLVRTTLIHGPVLG